MPDTLVHLFLKVFERALHDLVFLDRRSVFWVEDRQNVVFVLHDRVESVIFIEQPHLRSSELADEESSESCAKNHQIKFYYLLSNNA